MSRKSEQESTGLTLSSAKRTLKNIIFSSQALYAVLGGAFGYASLDFAGMIYQDNIAWEKMQPEADRYYPRLSVDDLATATELIKKSKPKVDNLLDQNDIEGAKQALSDPSLKDASDLTAIAQARQEFITLRTDQRDRSRFPRDMAISLGSILGLLTVGMYKGTARNRLLQETHENQSPSLSAEELYYPNWATDPPGVWRELEFSRALTFLPPVGGKIAFNRSGQAVIEKFTARRTALEHAEEVLSFLKTEDPSGEVIHQISVQGQLPDAFKVAAIGLILSGTYMHDWGEPFYDMPWGGVAPLVHDGGVYDTRINPMWVNVRGRTDYIERLPRVKEPEGLKILEHEGSAIISEDAASFNLVDVNFESIKFRSGAYQLLGLACHAAFDTTPEDTDEETRKRLARQWNLYAESIQLLSQQYGFENLRIVPWFRGYKRHHPELGSQLGYRYEADWPPVKSELSRLERIRWTNPNLRVEATALLEKTVSIISDIIGF